MKNSLVMLSVLFSTNVWAASQLTCEVSQDVNPPLQTASVKYQITAPLNGPDFRTRIDLEASVLDGLKFGVESFLSELTSPGQQVVLIGITDKTGAGVTVDGHGSATTFYDTAAGTLSISCSVQ
jgi:hypothetical protein